MKANHPQTNEVFFFVDNCLPFGVSISCTTFQEFSDALAHISRVRAERDHGLIYIRITNYLDDFLFVAFMMKICNFMMGIFRAICNEVRCLILEEKTEYATEIITFLGMLLSGEHFTISIPENKLNKAMYLLKLMVESKKARIKQIQQLMGLLNFFSRAIVPGCTFTRRMYDKLKTKNSRGQQLKGYHHVNLCKDFKKDCMVWMRFIQMAQ